MAILTVSRQLGSGGTEIGRKVAEEAGYGYIDREQILEALRKAGPKWEEWAKELDEHCPTVWERFDWSFRGFTSLVQGEILASAARGNVVIMGRGANFLLEGIRCAYRVRIAAPLDFRIDRVVDRDHIDRGTARWLVTKADAERSCFIQSVYGRQPDDPAGYDAVIEMTGQTIDDIVRALKETLTALDQYNTAEARQALQMRAAAARVKAGIATNPRFFVPTLEIQVEEDSLVMRGVIHSAKEYQRLEEEAAKLAGSIPIRCGLNYRW